MEPTFKLTSEPENAAKLEAGGSRSAASCSPVGAIVTDLPAKHYQTIVIDPPWPGPDLGQHYKSGAPLIQCNHPDWGEEETNMREIDPTFGEMCADYSRQNA